MNYEKYINEIFGDFDVAKLNAFETKVGNLPDQYKIFLQNYNGCQFKSNHFCVQGEEFTLDELNGLHYETTHSLEFYYENFINSNKEILDDVPEIEHLLNGDYIQIGHDEGGNPYLMKNSEPNYGTIYYLDYVDFKLYEVANSFEKFLSLLEENPNYD